MEYPRKQYLISFKLILDSMLNLTIKKNNDYGGETDAFKNFQEFGEFGILVRMSDKWARIKTALKEKRELKVKDETIDDTILDLAVYCIILLIWRKVHKNGRT